MQFNYKLYLALLAPYAFTVSSLYLLGFWRAFDINPFEYITLSDIIKISIYHLAFYSSIAIFVAGLMYFLLVKNINESVSRLCNKFKLKKSDNTESTKPKPTNLKLAFKVFSSFFLIAVILFSVIKLALWNPIIGWMIIGTATHSLLLVSITSTKILKEIQNETLRTFIIFVPLLILTQSYTWGIVAAEDQTLHPVSVEINDKVTNTNYVGKLGDVVVFWQNGEVKIVPSKQIGTITYYRNP